MGLNRRSREAEIENKLMNDIEPNPGPRTTLQRAARTRRRIKKRLEKGNQKRKRKEEQLANVKLKVATWNVRRANIYNGRFGEIVKECIKRGWDIVCVSELNARVNGIKRYTHDGNKEILSSFKEIWDLDDRKCVQCVGNARKTLAAKRQTNNG